MKKIVALIFLISSFAQAQFTVKGTLTKTLDTDWVILYRIDASKHKFLQNTKIKIDTILVDGKKQTIGTFQFQLPTDSKIGSYKINYSTNGSGSVGFIFNNENVSFTFHPDYPEQTVLFSESKENIIYKNYLQEVFIQQQKLDSLQITAIENPALDLKLNYKKTLSRIHYILQKYLEETKEMYVKPFIKASLRTNSPEIKTTRKEYWSDRKTSFFDNIGFSNKALINSTFLLDRITEYIFYLNYSESKETLQKLYKIAIDTIFSKVKNTVFKKNIIVFLIERFEKTENLEMIDFLFKNYYDKLPTSLKSEKFKNEKIVLFTTGIGRIAPDFFWKENEKKLQLSTLNEAKNYVLVFWSTDCSHCLKEIPELHKLLRDKKAVKVVAFSMEKNDFRWKKMIATLPNWHHILGLNKWENKIAKMYNISGTPTYIVLDANKKIIAKPLTIGKLSAYLEKL